MKKDKNNDRNGINTDVLDELIKDTFDIILVKLKQLKKNYKTIGNYYLIKNSSKTMEEFLSNE